MPRGAPVSRCIRRGPVAHPGGDRSLYLEDPAGNVVELWDFFLRSDGAAEGVRALAAADD